MDPMTPLSDSLEEAAGDRIRLLLCVQLKNAPVDLRATFCGSLLRRDKRARCYSHAQDSAVEWANWCFGEFGN